MIPYNYIDLLTLDKQKSRFLTGQKVNLGQGNPGDHLSTRVHHHDPTPQQQIKVSSTIDADIVLRRVIEDRAAILALQSRAATNLAELAKAKTRQIKISEDLRRQDREIARLTSKAKLELAEYNKHSKSYIRAFMIAFEKGDLDILPHVPFSPSLEELEAAINLRKSTLIERVQADDRVKKLAFIDSQERVTEKVMKMNQEAFLRAIEIAKQQYNESTQAWLDRANALLSTVPRRAPKFSDAENSDARRPHEAPVVFTSAPPTKQQLRPRHHHHNVPQDLGLPQMKKVMNPNIFAVGRQHGGLGNVSPELPAKRPVDIAGIAPMGSSQPESVQVQLISPRNKRQKIEEPSSPPVVDLCVSPVGSAQASDGMSHDEAGSSTDGQNCAGAVADATAEEMKEEISIAQVLTDMHGRNDPILTSDPQGGTFAVANI